MLDQQERKVLAVGIALLAIEFVVLVVILVHKLSTMTGRSE